MVLATEATDSNTGFYECSNGHKSKLCVSRYHNAEIWDMCFECGVTITTRYRTYQTLPVAHSRNNFDNPPEIKR